MSMTDFKKLVKVADSLKSSDIKSVAKKAITMAQSRFPETFKKLGE